MQTRGEGTCREMKSLLGQAVNRKGVAVDYTLLASSILAVRTPS